MKEVFAHGVGYKKQRFKELITKMVSLAQAIGYAEEQWVTPKERELLEEIIRQYYAGIRLDSRESVEEIVKNTSFTGSNKGIYIYRGHLKKKGWINQTPSGFDLPPFLKSLNPESPEHVITIGINSLEKEEV